MCNYNPLLIDNGSCVYPSDTNLSIVSYDYYITSTDTLSNTGIFYDTLINIYGCDSLITINLTINNSSTSSSTVTACDSFDWNGQTYTSSGTYTWTATNSVGCDSVATLNLTINNSSTSSSIIT